nr:hypothetical protein [Tanacetum cinerariifolium]
MCVEALNCTRGAAKSDCERITKTGSLVWNDALHIGMRRFAAIWFRVADNLKTAIEQLCRGAVLCADILLLQPQIVLRRFPWGFRIVTFIYSQGAKHDSVDAGNMLSESFSDSMSIKVSTYPVKTSLL